MLLIARVSFFSFYSLLLKPISCYFFLFVSLSNSRTAEKISLFSCYESPDTFAIKHLSESESKRSKLGRNEKHARMKRSSSWAPVSQIRSDSHENNRKGRRNMWALFILYFFFPLVICDFGPNGYRTGELRIHMRVENPISTTRKNDRTKQKQKPKVNISF